ncbi:MAG: DUF4301 family protein [Candidatus Aphodosoma sp.]
MLGIKDIQQLASVGISERTAVSQLNDLKNGYAYLKLDGAAQLGKGILRIDSGLKASAVSKWKEYRGQGSSHRAGGKILKFVPASGAASRMFKDLYEFRNSLFSTPDNDETRYFFDNITGFAFYDELNACCLKVRGASVPQLIADGGYKSVLEILLDEGYLAYGHLPKGLLSFHKYGDEVRKAVSEHLVEGAMYAAGGNRDVHIHFTVSPEHRELFCGYIDSIRREYEQRYGVSYDITLSVQKKSTDTVALDADGELVRNADGSILLRPGGHGALIENLNDVDADIVFIKNIDNVVPDRLKDITVEYKELIAGILVMYQQRIFGYMQLLDGEVSDDCIDAMLHFSETVLCTRPGSNKLGTRQAKIEYLRRLFNRPMRVCGMVKNEGEPGGGPYLAYNANGTVSPQILESSQIDKSDKDAVACMKNAKFFNPVDIVCGITDYKGNRFDLVRYVDCQTGFISEKSKNGKSMRVLELPGLWNGAMSDWITVFVEVPVATFNPVKTVNDLLREQHR